MKYPKFLNRGGTIGFPAPSYGASIEPYTSLLNNAFHTFKEKGYKVNAGPNAFLGKGIGISNTPELCAKELEEMYISKDNDVLISVGGGELMCETLSALDISKIKSADPKWFLGYSDNTNFEFVLATNCDVASLYGSNSSEFGMKEWYESVRDCFSLLSGENLVSHGYTKWEIEALKNENEPLIGYNLTEPTALRFYNWDKKPIEGRFIGGCLDVLMSHCGTRFDHTKEFCGQYKEDGIVWFLEACDLSPTGIRRALWQLDNAGWFENAKAFIFGRPGCIADGKDFVGLDEYSAVLGVLGKYNVPIIMDADLGHMPPTMTMINGGYGKLSKFGESNIQIEWQLK